MPVVRCRGACFRISPRLRWLELLCLDARCRLPVTVSSGGRLSHATTNHDAEFTAAASLADAPPLPHPRPPAPQGLSRPVMAGKAANRSRPSTSELARAFITTTAAAVVAATAVTAPSSLSSPSPPPPLPLAPPPSPPRHRPRCCRTPPSRHRRRRVSATIATGHFCATFSPTDKAISDSALINVLPTVKSYVYSAPFSNIAPGAEYFAFTKFNLPSGF